MNALSHWICRSGYRGRTLERKLLRVLKDFEPGSEVLEIGPGYGFISARTASLTCVEADEALAHSLSRRMRATLLCFTMLPAFTGSDVDVPAGTLHFRARWR
jgi:hypothetical protein